MRIGKRGTLLGEAKERTVGGRYGGPARPTPVMLPKPLFHTPGVLTGSTASTWGHSFQCFARGTARSGATWASTLIRSRPHAFERFEVHRGRWRLRVNEAGGRATRGEWWREISVPDYRATHWHWEGCWWEVKNGERVYRVNLFYWNSPPVLLILSNFKKLSISFSAKLDKIGTLVLQLYSKSQIGSSTFKKTNLVPQFLF